MNKMKKMTNLFMNVMACLLFIHPLTAQIKLPAIISSNMVLQRNTEVALWGWAGSNEEVTIEASWLNSPVKVKADQEGNWKTTVNTTASKEPQTLTISGKSSKNVLGNVLFGEVWLCSGQSNMQQPLKGYQGQPTFGSQATLLKSNNPNLRLFSVDRIGSKVPIEELQGYQPWQQATPDNVVDFSAVGYFFASQLQEALDVPVGIIHSSWGGSLVEAWISRDVLSKFQEIDLTEADAEGRGNRVPTSLFNSMINPLIPYTLQGFLWYQGESNRLNPEEYKSLFPAMVEDWRNRWQIGDIPFYYVQIAPYRYSGDEGFVQSFENSAFIREAQLQCLDLIPNSGMAVTMDIGDSISIHPPKKKEVADRLLYIALNQTYGLEGVDGASPVYDSYEKRDNGMLLKFKHAETGLYALDELNGFEIAGEDKVFHPAEAKIVERNYVLVSSEKVPEPVAVRYAWKNWTEGTLYDVNLLPAPSFRTDNWQEASRAAE